MSASRSVLRHLAIALLLLAPQVAWGQETKPAAEPKEKAPEPKGPQLPPGVRMVGDIEYGRFGDTRLLLDVFVPEQAPTNGKGHPVVVWIHGGAWEGGGKGGCPGVFLVPKGYAVVSISYRLTHVASFPAQIQDCKGAIRWVRAHAKEHSFDAEQIGVWGASAGGHLAALLGTSGGVKELEGDTGGNVEVSSKVQAVCDWFGPTDIVKLCRFWMTGGADDGTKGTFNEKGERDGKRPDTPPIFKKLFGGELEDKLDVAKSANPIKYVDREDPPVLIMHGDKDPLVPLVQSEELRDSLKAAGVNVELDVIKDAGHGFWNQQIMDKIESFFDRHLKNGGKEAAPTKP